MNAETAQNEKQGSVPLEKGEELSKPNSSLESRLFATQELLRNEENSGVFIQLLGGTNEKILKQQIAELALLIDSNKIYAFRTIAKGKPYITILYGRFDDLESAREGIERLPNELKANRPYLRTTKGINSEIESNSKIPAN